ncbi:MMPL family transporter [Lysinibacillus fusiformis]|uniref:MMPL family transporter n=1 Tax=Lysinibacillus fusiformis TaxID=28031 RepID=UPI001E4C4E44|nr:MMPL family transporter [Lysinibacillus fusiformis]MCE4046288.1 MMPL family transporter [Lysinibacillus fusiformis]MDC6269906.1 MMPL family transporter [Lysinibacillus sphaericus]MDN4971147.1 MMPL family transporter [Lysinibacillus fusiformis]WEA39616.1 MMPL family transporter [Lysinibacillus fusiformis]
MKKHPLEQWGSMVASKKGRLLALAFWVLLVIVLSFAWPQINSIESESGKNLPDTEMSEQAAAMIAEQFPNDAGTPLLLVWYRDSGLTTEDYSAIQSIYSELQAKPLAHQTMVPPFDKMPPQALSASASENGTTIVTPVFFEKGVATDALQDSLDKLTKIMESNEVQLDKKLSNDMLHVRYSGPVGIATDAVSLFSQADVKLLIATVLLVLVLLIIIYRSPLLAIIPLLVVGLAYGVISPTLGFFADQGWIDKDSQAVSIMTVLLFGAGTDYCLFLISKYREVLFHVEDKTVAMKLAVKESGGAILMSALTVVIGLATLSLAHYGAFQRFAVPFSFGVLVMGIAALVVLPAILVIIGRVAFFPFVPRTEEMALSKGKKQHKPSHKISHKIGHFVTHKPWIVIAVTVILLGGLAAFVPRIQYTFDLLSSFPKDMPSREGFTLIEENFSPGELAPVQLVIDTEGNEINLQQQLSTISYIDSVADVQIGEKNNAIQLYELSLNANPYAKESLAHIPELKAEVVEMLEQSGLKNADKHVWIGGETASQYDTQQITKRDETVIMPTMIALIALLLFVYLRSITATVYLLATVIISYFGALGAGWLILHHIMGAEAISGAIPLYAFVFLVALGEDYNIFMISEIWKKRKTTDHLTAVEEGVVRTGSVITSAGLILAGTFAVLATLPIQVLVQFGVVTAIGVLLDTFIVRPLLVPAITTVLGKYAFWPGKLFKKEV